jgi:transcriptional repressor of cell division inhibition gene dicB
MLKKIVINYFKSPKKVADALMISPAAVSQWREIIPEKNAYRIQELTKGELKVDPKLYRDQ